MDNNETQKQNVIIKHPIFFTVNNTLKLLNLKCIFRNRKKDLIFYIQKECHFFKWNTKNSIVNMLLDQKVVTGIVQVVKVAECHPQP